MITSAAVANSSLFILHSSFSIVQRYNIFRAPPNLRPPIGSIFSTNLANFNETYYRTLESVISDHRVLLFAAGEQDASRVPPSHRPIKVGVDAGLYHIIMFIIIYIIIYIIININSRYSPLSEDA